MHKAFIYRLYPTAKQAEHLTWVLDRCRELYNAALEERREAYRMAGKTRGYCEQASELPGLKRARWAWGSAGNRPSKPARDRLVHEEGSNGNVAGDLCSPRDAFFTRRSERGRGRLAP